MKVPESKTVENKQQEGRNNLSKRGEGTEYQENQGVLRENSQPVERNNNRNRNNRRTNGNNRRPNDGSSPENRNTEVRKQEGEIHA